MSDFKQIAEAYVKMKTGTVNESSENFPYKSIMFNMKGNTTTFYFVFNENEKEATGEWENVNYDTWKKSNKKDVSSDKQKDRMIATIFSHITQMRDKVDANSEIKRARTFEDKMDVALKYARMSTVKKTGVKTTRNLF